jgi:hypothetical protein
MAAKLLKFVLVGVVAFLAIVGVSVAWFVRLVRLVRSEGVTGAMAVDVTLITHSPCYWLLVAVILALAGWACYRWAWDPGA